MGYQIVSFNAQVQTTLDGIADSLRTMSQGSIQGPQEPDALEKYVRSTLSPLGVCEPSIQAYLEVVRAYHRLVGPYPEDGEIVRGLLTVLFRGESIPEAYQKKVTHDVH